MAGEGERGGEAELARRSEPAWPDPALATRRPALEEKPPGDMANGEVGGRRRRREAGWLRSAADSILRPAPSA